MKISIYISEHQIFQCLVLQEVFIKYRVIAIKLETIIRHLQGITKYREHVQGVLPYELGNSVQNFRFFIFFMFQI